MADWTVNEDNNFVATLQFETKNKNRNKVFNRN